MNLILLSSLISDLEEIWEEAQNKPQMEIPSTQKLEPSAREALGDHPRFGEVVGHLGRGSASSALAVLNEIRSAAQSAPPAS